LVRSVEITPPIPAAVASPPPAFPGTFSGGHSFQCLRIISVYCRPARDRGVRGVHALGELRQGKVRTGARLAEAVFLFEVVIGSIRAGILPRS
jgi:hypothetical protein